MLDDLSAVLGEGFDLAASFGRVGAGWRAAVPGCLAVTVSVHRDDGAAGPVPVLVLSDAVDHAGTDVAASMSIPLGGGGGLSTVLRVDAGTPSAFHETVPPLSATPATGGAVRAAPDRRRDRGGGPAEPLAAEAVRNQAVGILLHHHGGSPAQAGDRLRALAAAGGRGVADAAADLIEASRRRRPTAVSARQRTDLP